MKSNFNDCLTRVLKDEGGYSNDPSDSGGPTNFGITIADYRLYVNKSGTASDVKNMKLSDAKTIYKTKYWDTLNCDNLPSGVDYTCFDYGVNSGLGRPRKALQRFKSLTGTKLIDAINDERTTFLQAIAAGKNAKFLAGWLARVKRVRAHSLELYANKPSGALASTGAATGAVVAGSIAVASTPQHYWPWIVSGTIMAAIITFFVFEWHAYRKSTNV